MSALPATELRAYREADPSVQIIAHPECPPDVLAEADFTGSTAHMINWVRNKRPKRVVMITECSMADNVQAELPDVEMVRPCNLCPHMKRITLAEDSRQPDLPARGSHHRSPDRRKGAAFGRADDQPEELRSPSSLRKQGPITTGVDCCAKGNCPTAVFYTRAAAYGSLLSPGRRIGRARWRGRRISARPT